MILQDLTKIRNLKHMVDYAAENYGENPFCTYKTADGLESKTYNDFQAETQAVSRFLIQNGLKGAHAAIIASNSYAWLAAHFGIVSSGSVSVPLAAGETPQQLCKLVDFADCKAVFLDNAHKDLINQMKQEAPCVEYYILLDADGEDGILGFEDLLREYAGEYTEEPDGNSVCAIMFTSGTTGEPKGVLIRQEYLLNMCEWYGERFKLDSDSRLILLNNFGFDGSLKTIFTPLLYGSSIVLATDSLFDVKTDAEIIKKYEVTHFACVPSLMQGIIEYCGWNGYKELESVKYVISAGEKFRSSAVLKWLKNGNCSAEFVNLYGPAECSCCVSYHNVTEDDLEKDIIPIGKPIYNKRMYILDDDLAPCPVGTEGDIWIAGLGTFDGYIGMSPEASGLSADIMDSASFMYMSGDRGKRLDNGEVLYCGRKDNQIKISGQRIEIEEIEQVLMRHDNITSCGLFVKNEDQAVKTIMFYSTADKKEMTYDELSGFMEKSLLKGVIPNRFVYLEKLPVSINGKLDRNALEGLIPAGSEVGGEETDELTQKLVLAWKNTLEIDEVPLDKGFFELGGYSMLLYHLQSEIKQLLGKDISPMEILAHPTVRNMAAFLKGEDTASEEAPNRNRRIRRTRR